MSSPLMLREWSPQESSRLLHYSGLEPAPGARRCGMTPPATGWALGHRVVFRGRTLSSFVGQGSPESFEPSDLGVLWNPSGPVLVPV